MKSKPPITASEGLLATGLGAASALAMVVALSTLSAPANFAIRLDGLRDQAQSATTMLDTTAKAAPLEAGVVCRRDPVAQAQALRNELTNLGAAAGLTVEGLAATAETDGGDGALIPIRVRFSAVGSYEGAIALLGSLTGAKPRIFVDVLDLAPKTSNVTLRFSGRVFCSA